MQLQVFQAIAGAVAAAGAAAAGWVPGRCQCRQAGCQHPPARKAVAAFSWLSVAAKVEAQVGAADMARHLLPHEPAVESFQLRQAPADWLVALSNVQREQKLRRVADPLPLLAHKDGRAVPAGGQPEKKAISSGLEEGAQLQMASQLRHARPAAPRYNRPAQA